MLSLVMDEMVGHSIPDPSLAYNEIIRPPPKLDLNFSVRLDDKMRLVREPKNSKQDANRDSGQDIVNTITNDKMINEKH